MAGIGGLLLLFEVDKPEPRAPDAAVEEGQSQYMYDGIVSELIAGLPELCC